MCGPFLPYREELWLREVKGIALRYRVWDPDSETKFYQTSKPGLFTECDIKMSVKDNIFYQSRTSEKKGILFYLNSALQLRQWRPGESSCFKLHVGDSSVLLFVASNSYRFLYCGLEKMILNILPSFLMLKQTIPLILGSQGSFCSRAWQMQAGSAMPHLSPTYRLPSQAAQEEVCPRPIPQAQSHFFLSASFRPNLKDGMGAR